VRIGVRACTDVRWYVHRVTGSDQDTAVTDATQQPVPVSRGDDCILVIRDGENLLSLVTRFNLVNAASQLGRDDTNDIVLAHEKVSRHHARIERDGAGCTLVDLASRNGTFVNDARVAGSRLLAHGDLIRIGPVVFKFLTGTSVEREHFEEIARAFVTDHLTQLGTVKMFEDRLAQEANRARRYARDLSVVMLDIDYFKKVNDTFGHDGGDAVLRAVAAVIRSLIRDATDVAARLGGEELAVILPEMALEGAVSFAESVRAALEREIIVWDGNNIRVTASFGCATLAEDEEWERLRSRCDAKLYEAKGAGRNCVRY
jgi:diguanylate cyclase (GGDEF)-like protein